VVQLAIQNATNATKDSKRRFLCYQRCLECICGVNLRHSIKKLYNIVCMLCVLICYSCETIRDALLAAWVSTRGRRVISA